MKCLNCNGTDFDQRKVRMSPKIKNQLIEVIFPCSVCIKCGKPLLNAAQMNILRRTASDSYREKNGLLTSKQIIKYRENLKMSQTAFANYLEVGEASIKRWESSYIQDFSQDDHIRVKCDEEIARKNYLFLSAANGELNIYTGNKCLSLSLFDAIHSYLGKMFPSSLSFNNLCFYIDFSHFKKFNESITGFKYIPLKNGPCPFTSDLFSLNKGKKIERSFHAEAFDDREINTIDNICKIYSDFGDKKFSELSRNEKGYVETDESSYISYQFAHNLLI